MRGKIALFVSAVAAFHVSAANSLSDVCSAVSATESVADSRADCVTSRDNRVTSHDGRVASIDELCRCLASAGDYRASVRYGVLLPAADNEVVYDIDLQSAAAADTLAPCRYLISWEVDAPSGKSTGFNAYADGNHFRYSDERLQEYHIANDSTPFVSAHGGVQRNARFTELLPAFIAGTLESMINDSTYTYTFNPGAKYAGKDAVRIDAVQDIKGYTAREISYIFDAGTALPLRIAIESNPGAVSEQSITIDYSNPEGESVGDFSETTLMALYPEVFERFRSGNFRLENLPGTAMPRFSLPTLGGERVTHHRGEPFSSPTIIAVIDPDVASVSETINDVRSAVASLPFAVDVVWAVNSRHQDTVEQLFGKPTSEGEKILLGANSIIRDCGITAFPALIFAGKDGVIKSVHIGANKNLAEIVMQKVAVM